ncbi:sigma-70 family RNA polymerase sigma factor [Flavonifractor sp.]|uniref:RNA polymerase sigma factor n=1 Tax=Flavonifractor sp. TaxID=2049025 RepID=UPI0025BD69B0|nr:sigma-70 family RNA polymerase sigma factor [Flavonifractor sp.]
MDGENWREPAELARAYAPAIYRLAYARTGSRADAEDIMQEVFVRLLRARPDFADRAHARAWLLRVAANCANDWFRAPWRRREGPLTDALPAPEHEDGGVVEAVLALPAKYRTAVHLYYYEELSVAEIAKITGKSESAVKSRLFRARAMLREALKEDDDVSERL